MEKWLTLRLGQGKYKMSQEQEHRTFFYYIKLNKQIKKKKPFIDVCQRDTGAN